MHLESPGIVLQWLVHSGQKVGGAYRVCDDLVRSTSAISLEEYSFHMLETRKTRQHVSGYFLGNIQLARYFFIFFFMVTKLMRLFLTDMKLSP